MRREQEIVWVENKEDNDKLVAYARENKMKWQYEKEFQDKWNGEELGYEMEMGFSVTKKQREEKEFVGFSYITLEEYLNPKVKKEDNIVIGIEPNEKEVKKAVTKSKKAKEKPTV